MSKRQSCNGNTLFNYFARSPSVSNSGTKKDEKSSLENETPKKTKEKRPLDTSHDENIKPTKRRKRIIADSDSSDNEEKKEKATAKDVELENGSSDGNDKNTENKLVSLKRFHYLSEGNPEKKEDSNDENEEIIAKKEGSSNGNNKSTKKKLKSTSDENENSSDNDEYTENKEDLSDENDENIPQKKNVPRDKTDDDSEKKEENIWLHNRLFFLKPDKIKDKNGKKPSDPGYDLRTLYVPGDFLAKQTPAHRQWWEMKSKHYDCVLMFKVGKFYELYHMDAVTGVNELGLTFMKGDFAHSGFPESAYGRISDSLVERGYKVARVEQTETPKAMAERARGGGKHTKVVKREICQITTKATRVHGLQNVELSEPWPCYLLAISEYRTNDEIEFGVCFVDTSIGTFHLGQFKDDRCYSRLLTLLAEHPPGLLLEERKQLSAETKSVLRTALGNIKIETLNSKSEFYTSSKTLQLLHEKDYFKRNGSDDNIQLPALLQSMISESDSLDMVCKAEYDLAMQCLGACLWYLQDGFLDVQLLTMGKFELYTPSDMSDGITTGNKCMVLNSYALESLNMLGENESLLNTLNHCCTPLGKRLLHQWICRPLCDVEEIRNRQDAISELIERPADMQSAKEMLLKLPDLERYISRIHLLGNPARAKDHPDSRAILYEEKTYSKNKIHDFVTTLNGFESAIRICDMLSDVKSRLLRKHVCVDPEGIFPDMSETVNFFKNSFNAEEAEKLGKIIPQYGVDAEYDSATDEINKVQNKLDKYLESQKKIFGSSVSYSTVEKNRYQLEIPDSASNKITRDYVVEGVKKGSKKGSSGIKRLTTNETKKLLAEMVAAEARSKDTLLDLNRRIFEKFSSKFDEWKKICHCLAVLDVLLALAEYTNSASTTMCVPDVQPFSSESSMIVIKDGIHPCISDIESFVPNGINLGTENHSSLLLLTGPNMGGKSTLMRQVALLSIMAQIGCHVPASSMSFTCVDRLFTRLGAVDDIIGGRSTFMTELLEASSILNHATSNSLVFVDELGRGTSTYDGTAIATAYLTQLVNIKCRSMFSTHYHSLLTYFKGNTHIQLGHMACQVESEEDEVTQETVTFMYKLVPGPCPRSYGFNAARLAGIPIKVTNRANYIAQQLESNTATKKMMRKMFLDGNIREFLDSVCI